MGFNSHCVHYYLSPPPTIHWITTTIHHPLAAVHDQLSTRIDERCPGLLLPAVVFMLSYGAGIASMSMLMPLYAKLDEFGKH